MPPYTPNYVRQWRSDPQSTTNDGGYVIDSYGQRWNIVSVYGPDGTCSQKARIVQRNREGEVTAVLGQCEHD